jgi:putative ABC transport system permease protein
MLSYNLKLAWLSIKRNPVLSGLMMLAIAVGIGAFMTMLSVYYIQSGNPLWYKNEQVLHPQIDTWNPERPTNQNKPDRGPDLFTYRDAMALYASDIPDLKTVTFKTGDIIQPSNEEIAAFSAQGRMTHNDFFQIFDVPFDYGNGWDDRADESGDFTVVLDQNTNMRLFGGENSVGRLVRIGDYDFTVSGVLAKWEPIPKYFDPINGAYERPVSYYMPFALHETLRSERWGNTNCWKNEDYEGLYSNFINGECVFITHWVQIDDAARRDEYRDFLSAYTQEQATIGRSARPENVHLNTVEEWLAFNEVVPDDNRVLAGLSFLFLIVCLLNTVGLLLAKFMGRAGEVSVRRALGASRWTIFRQQLMECAAIGAVGGVAGIGITVAGVLAVKSLYRVDADIAVPPEMLGMAIALSILTSLAAGIWPAWQITRVPPAGYLKTQ